MRSRLRQDKRDSLTEAIRLWCGLVLDRRRQELWEQQETGRAVVEEYEQLLERQQQLLADKYATNLAEEIAIQAPRTLTDHTMCQNHSKFANVHATGKSLSDPSRSPIGGGEGQAEGTGRGDESGARSPVGTVWPIRGNGPLKALFLF